MKLGFIGLGRMGNRMVMKLLSEGHEVVVWNRSSEKVDDLMSQKKPDWKLSAAVSVEELVKSLDAPKVIWSMLPAGDATEQVLMGSGGIAEFVEKGDIVVDGGNSRFADTQRRYKYFVEKGVLFLGIGVSGGVIAFEDGYPMMVGGSKEGYGYIKPILDSLAKPGGGHEYFGEGGAGHFVKMIHNAIEYGYMQAIGEGFGVMDKAPYDLDLLKVAKLYTKGTLVSGFMMDRTVEALADDPKLEKIAGYIEDSGEGRWAVEQAKGEKVPIEVIEESLEFRVKSRDDEKVASTFAARMVAALRFAFGRHEVKKK
jgi:6-phosphogluconate dehydrogenase